MWGKTDVAITSDKSGEGLKVSHGQHTIAEINLGLSTLNKYKYIRDTYVRKVIGQVERRRIIEKLFTSQFGE